MQGEGDPHPLLAQCPADAGPPAQLGTLRAAAFSSAQLLTLSQHGPKQQITGFRTVLKRHVKIKEPLCWFGGMDTPLPGPKLLLPLPLLVCPPTTSFPLTPLMVSLCGNPGTQWPGHHIPFVRLWGHREPRFSSGLRALGVRVAKTPTQLLKLLPKIRLPQLPAKATAPTQKAPPPWPEPHLKCCTPVFDASPPPSLATQLRDLIPLRELGTRKPFPFQI